MRTKETQIYNYWHLWELLKEFLAILIQFYFFMDLNEKGNIHRELQSKAPFYSLLLENKNQIYGLAHIQTSFKIQQRRHRCPQYILSNSVSKRV